MFCPRCGTENDGGNRFCVDCGASLPERRAGGSGERGDSPEGEPSPARKRLDEVVGTSRRARIVSALTVVAIGVAVIAFIVLQSDDGEGVPQDAYLRQLDRQCVQEKARLSALEAEMLKQQSPDFGAFVDYLVRYVTEWHANLQATPLPPAHVEGVRAVEGALLEVLIEAGHLGTAVRRGSQTGIVKAAEHVDVATGQVDPALEFVGLERCAAVAVNPLKRAD